MEQYLEKFTLFTSIKINTDLSSICDNNKVFLNHGNIYVFDREQLNNYTNIYEIVDNKTITKIKLDIPTDHKVYLYPFINIEEQPQSTIYNFISNYKLTNLIRRVEKINDSYYINYYVRTTVDIYKLPRNIYQHIENVFKYKLDTYRSINNEIALADYTKVDIYEPDIDPTIYKNLLRDGIDLYNYQLNDIKWMYKLTENIKNNNNKIDFCIPITFDINENYVFYINRIYKREDYVKYGLSTHKGGSIIYKGGNIVSEMGLGKTMISLYYILSTNPDKYIYDQFINNEYNDKCNYFYKRGKNKGSNCVKSKVDELYCREHQTTVFIDKKRLVLQNTNLFDINNFITGDYIKTNASLIICPPHLCDQWVSEYYNKFNNDKFRVVLIVTSDQLNNVTFADILLSDIVVISYQMLSRYNFSNFDNNINDLNKHTLNKFKNTPIDDLLKFTKCELGLFKWNHIFLDECHEINNMKSSASLINKINCLQSETSWNITGTPFVKGVNSLHSLLNYNTINNYNYLSNIIDSTFIRDVKILFRRNIKHNIQNELTRNIINEVVKRIEFTTQERNIYTSNMGKNINFLIKLCCDIELNKENKTLFENCKSFDEIQQVMLDITLTKLNTTKTDLETTAKNLTTTQKMYNVSKNNNESDYIIQNIKNNLTTLKQQHTRLVNTIDTLQRSYNYLKAVVDSLSDESECPICLDTLERQTLTKCGHRFCWECLYETHQTKNMSSITCPTCNTLLKNTEIYVVEKTIPKKEQETELTTFVDDTKSSKIGNIVYFLKTELKPQDKVIVFSQWDDILHKIGGFLKKFNINFVYCTGTVYNKKKVIKQFTSSSDINIILLSSCNSASGINLISANKILLIEPVYGSKTYRDDIEAQAIGRADRIGQKRPIDVYRFIIKDTIEEQLLNNDPSINIKELLI